MIAVTLNLWYFFALYSTMLVGIFVFPRPFKWVAYGVMIAWTVFVLIWAVFGGTVLMSTSADNVFGRLHVNGLVSLFNVQ